MTLLPLRTSQHALERFQVHHPDATHSDLVLAIEAGEKVDWRVVWTLTQRRGEADSRDRFVLAKDSLGIFVVRRFDSYEMVQTYLRLSESQQAIVAVDIIDDDLLSRWASLSGDVEREYARGCEYPRSNQIRVLARAIRAMVKEIRYLRDKVAVLEGDGK